jgi:hypothetical protein
MTLSSVRLSESEKLALLRRLDRFRKWHSWNGNRYCLGYGHLLTGHQIQVVSDNAATTVMELTRPAEDCHSIPTAWVLPTPEILSRIGEPRSDQLSNRVREKASDHE